MPPKKQFVAVYVPPTPEEMKDRLKECNNPDPDIRQMNARIVAKAIKNSTQFVDVVIEDQIAKVLVKQLLDKN